MENYNPLASKDFGKDEASGMPQKLVVHRQVSDAKNNTVRIYWELVLISPTGSFASIIKSGDYSRYGSKATALRESPIGKGIQQLLQEDIDGVESLETIDTDLAQTEE